MAKKLGTVDFCDTAGGYGIIMLLNTDNACLVYLGDVADDCLPLQIGALMEFNIIYGSRGKQAINVTKYNGGN